MFATKVGIQNPSATFLCNIAADHTRQHEGGLTNVRSRRLAGARLGLGRQGLEARYALDKKEAPRTLSDACICFDCEGNRCLASSFLGLSAVLTKLSCLVLVTMPLASVLLKISGSIPFGRYSRLVICRDSIAPA